MKKLLLTLFGAGAVMGAWAAADTPDMLRSTSLQPVSKKMITTAAGKNSRPVLTRAGENTYEFGYSAGIGTALGWQTQGAVLEAAIEIPDFMSKGWKGMKITKVLVGFGCSPDKTINLYITDDLFGEAQYLQETVLDKEAISFLPSGAAQIDQVWNEVTLDTPYEINGNAFYVGYQTKITGSPCYPICFDLIYSETELGDILLAPDGNVIEEYHLGTLYGNICLKLVLEGEMPTKYDAMTDVLFTDNEVIGKDDQFSAGFTMLNIGSETITGLGINCTIDGKPLEDFTYTIYGEEEGSIPFGVLGYVEINGFPGNVTGSNLPVEVTITSLKSENGEGEFNEKLTTQVTIPEVAFTKNMLVEEFTGTWCGYCPRGIVGMEYMRSKYGNKGFIGIAAHYNDAMQAISYVPMIDYFSGGSFPSAVVNRAEYFDPSMETLEQYYNEVIHTAALAEVKVDAKYDEEANKLYATGSVEFGMNRDDANYAFAFVIKEDNVGPYAQTNNFAGGANGTLEGWSDKSRNVLTVFEMVARDITEAFGIEGSIPSKIEVGKTYTWNQQLPLNNVKYINNCQVVAMVLDLNTEEVLNSAEVSLEGQAGVENIFSDDSDGIYRVYNTQGVKVLETEEKSELNILPKGIYILNGKKIAIP